MSKKKHKTYFTKGLKTTKTFYRATPARYTLWSCVRPSVCH